MIITCEKCGTRFNLDESLLDADGSTVRCSRCRNIFTAFPPPPDLEFDDLDFSDIEFEENNKDLSETGAQDTDEPETLKLETTDPDEIEIEIETAEMSAEDSLEPLDEPDLSEELERHEKPALPEDVGQDLEDLDVEDLFSEKKESEFDPPFDDEKEDEAFEGLDEFDDTDTPPDKPPHEPPPPRRPARASLIHPPDRDGALMDVEDAPRKKRSAISVPVLVVLILFVVAAGGYVASTFLGYKIPFLPEIRIPFIQQYLPEKKEDPVSYPDPIPDQKSVTGRFITNDTAGELFIITGKIENPAQIPYRRIQVKGTLFQKEQKAAVSQTAFCGNIIPDETLRTSPIEELTAQLRTPGKTGEINDKVMPGKTVPFMLVFSNLPQNLENFTVEIAGFEHADP
jgi:predicted Zn finger-like uncharacterized protein